VAGKAGVFFDNSKPEEFVAGVMKLSEEKTWSNYSKAALQQSSRFSWKRSTQELLASLREIA
jgi:glycosyltransferase involved in cell wall biosynthesis